MRYPCGVETCRVQAFRCIAYGLSLQGAWPREQWYPGPDNVRCAGVKTCARDGSGKALVSKDSAVIKRCCKGRARLHQVVSCIILTAQWIAARGTGGNPDSRSSSV